MKTIKTYVIANNKKNEVLSFNATQEIETELLMNRGGDEPFLNEQYKLYKTNHDVTPEMAIAQTLATVLENIEEESNTEIHIYICNKEYMRLMMMLKDSIKNQTIIINGEETKLYTDEEIEKVKKTNGKELISLINYNNDLINYYNENDYFDTRVKIFNSFLLLDLDMTQSEAEKKMLLTVLERTETYKTYKPQKERIDFLIEKYQACIHKLQLLDSIRRELEEFMNDCLQELNNF